MESILVRTFGCQSHPFRQACRRVILAVQNAEPFLTSTAVKLWFQSLSPLMWEINWNAFVGNYDVNLVEVEIDEVMEEIIFPYPTWAFECHAKWPNVGQLPQSRTCSIVNFPWS